MLKVVLALIMHAQAVTLPPIVPIHQNPLPVDVAEPNISCDKIGERLEAFERMSNEHHIGVSNFLYAVAGKVQIWHSVLQPLEGNPNTLPAGVFEPLNDGAHRINDVANVSLDNAGLLANEMDRIKHSLAECVLTPR